MSRKWLLQDNIFIQMLMEYANRILNDIEPERSKRLNNLVNIDIYKTSYKKGSPKGNDVESAMVKVTKAKAEKIKNSAYALDSKS